MICSSRPVVHITLILAGLAAAGCSRLSEHPLVVEACKELQVNPRVAEVLGKPVTCSTSVRGTANETDGIAQLQFDATGSHATGVVVVEGKKTRGEWGVTNLELQPAGGAEPISLTTDVNARIGVDTPKFDPSAEPASSGTSAPPPPSEIEIQLPPGPPGQ
jgi:hypothetical protein